MQPELNFLTDIALQAGAMLARMQDGDLDIQLKGRADLVTRADKSVETFLIDQVLSRFPTHAIISEESGSHAGDPEHQWFIDPLDGTLNYAHGLRYYCTTIAYARRAAADGRHLLAAGGRMLYCRARQRRFFERQSRPGFPR